jgi:hypothetical protein
MELGKRLRTRIAACRAACPPPPQHAPGATGGYFSTSLPSAGTRPLPSFAPVLASNTSIVAASAPTVSPHRSGSALQAVVRERPTRGVEHAELHAFDARGRRHADRARLLQLDAVHVGLTGVELDGAWSELVGLARTAARDGAAGSAIANVPSSSVQRRASRGGSSQRPLGVGEQQRGLRQRLPVRPDHDAAHRARRRRQRHFLPRCPRACAGTATTV